ncbi:hypothetical protein IAT40_002691 [Kwoniella sp. CBS 6097]
MFSFRTGIAALGVLGLAPFVTGLPANGDIANKDVQYLPSIKRSAVIPPLFKEDGPNFKDVRPWLMDDNNEWYHAIIASIAFHNPDTIKGFFNLDNYKFGEPLAKATVSVGPDSGKYVAEVTLAGDIPEDQKDVPWWDMALSQGLTQLDDLGIEGLNADGAIGKSEQPEKLLSFLTGKPGKYDRAPGVSSDSYHRKGDDEAITRFSPIIGCSSPDDNEAVITGYDMSKREKFDFKLEDDNVVIRKFIMYEDLYNEVVPP